MVVLQFEGSVRVSKEGPPQIQGSGDDVAIFSELIGQGYLVEVYNTT